MGTGGWGASSHHSKSPKAGQSCWAWVWGEPGPGSLRKRALKDTHFRTRSPKGGPKAGPGGKGSSLAKGGSVLRRHPALFALLCAAALWLAALYRNDLHALSPTLLALGGASLVHPKSPAHALRVDHRNTAGVPGAAGSSAGDARGARKDPGSVGGSGHTVGTPGAGEESEAAVGATPPPGETEGGGPPGEGAVRPRLAFMFLTRIVLPLVPLWERFLEVSTRVAARCHCTVHCHWMPVTLSLYSVTSAVQGFRSVQALMLVLRWGGLRSAREESVLGNFLGSSWNLPGVPESGNVWRLLLSRARRYMRRVTMGSTLSTSSQ